MDDRYSIDGEEEFQYIEDERSRAGQRSWGDGPPPPAPEPSTRSSRTSTLLILLVSGFGMLALCCLVCGGVSWLGLGQIEKEVVRQYGQNPRVVAAIGPLTDASYDLVATGERGQFGVLVFRVVGKDGEGQLVVEQNDQPPTVFRNGILFLPDGREIDVDAPPDLFDGFGDLFDEMLREAEKNLQDRRNGAPPGSSDGGDDLESQDRPEEGDRPEV